ncbi:MAG TPA: trypsin-like peptidase domain-containing protein [Micropepsaceae bacterium]
MALIATLFLAGCAAMGSGVPSSGFANDAVKEAYLPLAQWNLDFKGLETRHGAALVVAPHVAVTNAHNANLLPREAILAMSDYDLLFFRTEKSTRPSFAPASLGEAVIAYGNGPGGRLRQAEGQMRFLDQQVLPLCAACRAQRVLGFEADAGPGFSGGPVVDAKSGAVLGIIFGFRDSDGRRLMYAYDSATVLAEMHRLLDASAGVNDAWRACSNHRPKC